MPDNFVVSQSIDGKVQLTWDYKPYDIDGFTVSYKPQDATEYTPLESVDIEQRAYTVNQELEIGKSYYFAVTAKSGKASSYPATRLYRILRDDELTGVRILRTLNSHAGIAVEYQAQNLPKEETENIGIRLSDSPDVTASNEVITIPAPANRRGKNTCMQVVPITRLPKDKSTLYIRAYAQGKTGDAKYSEPVEIKLAEQPKEIKLEWQDVTPESLKGKVEIYKTESKLNGRPFNAWYAVGNPAKSRIKRNDPQHNTPLSVQASAVNKALVLVNAAYFYGQTTLGLYGHGGLKGSDGRHRGSLRKGHPEYETMHLASRGFFGVTKAGEAIVCWAGTSQKDHKPHLYNHPMPILLGEALYADYLPEIVGKPVDFNPYYGVSAGPVVLKDGRVPVDFETFRDGQEYYVGNYEIIPYDIFGKTTYPDRTAVGVLEDGRIVLFVCDGRIPISKGANLIELAQIMKGIGCKDALNLDGGGSTNMWAAGSIINHKDIDPKTGDTRAIRSIIGFFDK